VSYPGSKCWAFLPIAADKPAAPPPVRQFLKGRNALPRSCAAAAAGDALTTVATSYVKGHENKHSACINQEKERQRKILGSASYPLLPHPYLTDKTPTPNTSTKPRRYNRHRPPIKCLSISSTTYTRSTTISPTRYQPPSNIRPSSSIQQHPILPPRTRTSHEGYVCCAPPPPTLSLPTNSPISNSHTPYYLARWS